MAGTPNPVRSWAVTAQQQTTKLDPSGNVVEGWNVSYRTGGGISGTVFIPAAQYGAAVVASAITASVAQNAEVAELSSDGS